MDDENEFVVTSDIAFTEAVKAQQEARGSRAGYARMEAKGGWSARIDGQLARFIAERDSFYFATANNRGQPYVQHRGGPPGFLRVLDDSTLGFADNAGNQQYISLGNLAENDKAFLFLMDYMSQRRVKIWGRARVIENDADLLRALAPEGGTESPSRGILVTVRAWDVNCPKFITPRFTEAQVAPLLDRLNDRIAELENELRALRAGQKYIKSD